MHLYISHVFHIHFICILYISYVFYIYYIFFICFLCLHFTCYTLELIMLEMSIQCNSMIMGERGQEQTKEIELSIGDR